jgi:hypothetical protein
LKPKFSRVEGWLEGETVGNHIENAIIDIGNPLGILREGCRKHYNGLAKIRLSCSGDNANMRISVSQKFPPLGT